MFSEMLKCELLARFSFYKKVQCGTVCFHHDDVQFGQVSITV